MDGFLWPHIISVLALSSFTKAPWLISTNSFCYTLLHYCMPKQKWPKAGKAIAAIDNQDSFSWVHLHVQTVTATCDNSWNQGRSNWACLDIDGFVSMWHPGYIHIDHRCNQGTTMKILYRSCFWSKLSRYFCMLSWLSWYLLYKRIPTVSNGRYHKQLLQHQRKISHGWPCARDGCCNRIP